ncbi:hypothetical protein J2Y03_000445 [Neobacillus niacini]|nr:hypothetical protein [Neobacillus niacini]
MALFLNFVLFGTKFNDYAKFLKKKNKFNKKRACKLNSKAQNNYFHVKIGFKILTTIITKSAYLFLVIPEICI